MSAGVDEFEVVVEAVNEEQGGGQEVEGLVESDYEMDNEPVATGEKGSQWVNFDFGFGVADAQQVRDSDTDCGDSNDLRSVHSEEEGRACNDAFNVKTDMEDPMFKIGWSKILFTAN